MGVQLEMERRSISSSDEYEITEPMIPGPHSPLQSSSRLGLSLLRYSAPFRLPHRAFRWLLVAIVCSIVIASFGLWRWSMIETRRREQTASNAPPSHSWEKYELLKRYYGGIKTLIPTEQNEPEYPSHGGNASGTYGSNTNSNPRNSVVDVQSEQYNCYLDEEAKIMVPKIRAYSGVPDGFPRPAIGSYDIFGLNSSLCFDRYGKFAPYGLRYGLEEADLGSGQVDDAIDFSGIRWGEAQERCVEKNSHRFKPRGKEPTTGSLWTMRPERLEDEVHDNQEISSREQVKKKQTQNESKGKIPRTAIVLRTWADFRYTPEVMVNLRSMIAELSLLSGGEYAIHFLIHVKDTSIPIWADEGVYNETLSKALPEEFAGMGILWSEPQSSILYPGIHDENTRLPAAGVYRALHLPLMWFAKHHPEYEYFWNWEMDARYIGQWYSLFSKLSEWAEKQPRKGLWERNARFYVPGVHGTWEEFRHRVEQAGGDSVWGPQHPSDTPQLDLDGSPPTSQTEDDYAWGVGEPADLITLNPIYNPVGTNWALGKDVSGYKTDKAKIPRRASMVNAARLSRRLLEAMHHESAVYSHSMFTEMYPSSIALHHGLKAVFAPHPIYRERAWPLEVLEKTINGGLNGASGGGEKSAWGNGFEHNFRGASWFYNDQFAGRIWRRWLGREAYNEGKDQRKVDESKEGRMCLPPMLMHPIKDVKLPDFI